MPSMTHWMRLEPRTRNEPSESGLEEGLEARIADPLWLLARQWQFGELRGEDAGSPVSVRARLEVAPFTRFRPGARSAAAAPQPYDPRTSPLETLVEQERVRPVPLRIAATAGQHFLRLLKEQGVERYHRRFTQAFPLEPPGGVNAESLTPADRAFLAVMAGRAPDANRLYAALGPVLRPGDGSPPRLPPQPQIDQADRAEVILAGLEWLHWYDSLYGEPPSGPSDQSWIAERQEYAFAVAAQAADGQIVLEAEEYTDGDLDWYVFDRMPRATLGTGSGDRPPRQISRTVIPSPVTYKGMPSTRWWEFEDAQVNFGASEAEPTDLVRLLVIEYALVYGDDWFVMPVELEMGAAYRTRSLVVTDTFGERTLIQPYTRVDGRFSPWRLFHPSVHRDAPPVFGQAVAEDPLLVLPPVLVDSLNGEPLEEVLFLRDEMANMAWAVEQHVESPVGYPLDRHRLFQARKYAAGAGANQGESPDAAVIYRLATEVPDYWIPLVPVAEDDQGNIRLRRARLLRADLQATGPLGRLLEAGDVLSLREEEVPSAGARVTRAWQFARWRDGSTHVWIGRRKGAGRGEGYSGLRFDVAEETGSPTAGTPAPGNN